MSREPGLIYRRAFKVDAGRVVVEEKWDTEAPGCPLIRSPWAPPQFQPGRVVVMQNTLTGHEFDRAPITLHEEQ